MIASLENVTVRRSGVTLLDDISWQVESGQHWAILGRNGSGKSLSLKILSGFLWPTSGSVEVLGFRFGKSDLRELRRQIGWVSLDLQMHFQRDVAVSEVILSGALGELGVYQKPTRALEDLARERLSQLQLGPIWDRDFRLLSYGEQKLVLIVRALMNSPKILILDEPATGLDLRAREDFLQSLQRITSLKSSPTLLFVTHHTEEILPFITHAIVLKAGRVLHQGNVREVVCDSVLTNAFETPVEIEVSRGRYWCRLRP